jgi:hypothetical protein
MLVRGICFRLKEIGTCCCNQPTVVVRYIVTVFEEFLRISGLACGRKSVPFDYKGSLLRIYLLFSSSIVVLCEKFSYFICALALNSGSEQVQELLHHLLIKRRFWRGRMWLV